MDVIGKRVQRAVESVLENETLVSGLDESAASALQDWGIKNVKKIAEETGDLDDERAEEAMYPKMKASRRLMSAIRVWLENESKSSAEERAALWDKIGKHAREMYGEDLHLPDAATFSAESPALFIKNLLTWFESYADGQKNGGNEDNEKKGFFQSLFGRR